VSDLIVSIKLSKIPIVCICNDKYKQSLKSLKNHCVEIDWRKPTKIQAAVRLRTICQAEGLSLNQVCPSLGRVWQPLRSCSMQHTRTDITIPGPYVSPVYASSCVRLAASLLTPLLLLPC
jgi:hypothetical protein